VRKASIFSSSIRWKSGGGVEEKGKKFEKKGRREIIFFFIVSSKADGEVETNKASRFSSKKQRASEAKCKENLFYAITTRINFRAQNGRINIEV
jgi:hypothetical protein